MASATKQNDLTIGLETTSNGLSSKAFLIKEQIAKIGLDWITPKEIKEMESHIAEEERKKIEGTKVWIT